MIEKNKIYTAADFERYYAGTMPADEMHELEKAALEDPFLADALEGYSYTPSFENDITELKEKLDERRKKKNVFSIFSFAHSGWWRVAALVIIITGAGYFFYRLNYKSKENSLAKNATKSVTLKKDNTFGNTDTGTKTNDVALNHQLSNDEEKTRNVLPVIKSNAQKEIYPGNKNKTISSSLVAEGSNQESDSTKFNMKSGKSDKNPLLPYSLKGKVTDEKGNALAFAKIENKNKNEQTLTDTAGRFLLSSADSNATAIVSVVGYGTKKVVLQKGKQPVIEMNKNNANLDELTTNSAAPVKKLQNSPTVFDELSGKVAGLEITNKRHITLAKTEKFDQYIKANIKPVSAKSDTLLTGEVFLSFTINKKGRPHNIKVIKSSCKECETEAIKLLENGPGWIGKRNNLQKVLIKF